MMALFALYSLANKKYQDSALIFLLISTIGWTIGQVISYFADGKPTSLVVISIVVQAAFGNFDVQPVGGEIGGDQQLQQLLREPRIAQLDRRDIDRQGQR